MGFWIPAILLGSVGASHHYASKELDYITKEADQPMFGFWWGVSLGVMAGVWIGVSFYGNISESVKWLEWIATIGYDGATRKPIRPEEPKKDHQVPKYSGYNTSLS